MAPRHQSGYGLIVLLVLVLLTACEAAKTGEQSAQSDRPPTHAAPVTESLALPVTPPPALPGSSGSEVPPHSKEATGPAPDVASIKPPPIPDPRVLANKAPTADDGGASAEATVAKVPDTTRPTVSIRSPAYGALLNRNPVTITGTVDDRTATVTVNQTPATITGGVFTTHVRLTEQGNNPLRATAIDRAGNRSTDSIMVTLDTIGPDISISAPLNGLVTKVPRVTVTGRISDAGELAETLLNGAPLALDRGDFSVGVPLGERENVITVSARDVAGNERSRTITVNLDTTVPAVVVVPAEPAEPDDDSGARSAEGGTLTGKVTFKGVPPAPKTFAFNKFPNPGFCSTIDSDGHGNRVVQEVTVGEDNALKDVVVYIEGVQGGKPFNFEGTKVTADGCRFLVQGGPSTFAGVVVKKKEIQIENMDADPNDPKAFTGVLHNPHAYEVAGASSTTIFNLPLPEKGQIVKKPVILRKKESIFKLECDQHNFMQAFFVPVENPYYAIVGDDGRFRIADIPLGTYKVYTWHPTLGKQEATVTIRANRHTTADFSFAAK